MTLVKYCENCGAKIEIEDGDNLSSSLDQLDKTEEEPQHPILCENCTLQLS